MSGIFVIQGDLGADSNLLEMNEVPYDSEALLQELIDRYPSLLAGNLVDPENPRRWLVVRREQPVPDGEQLRWSLDHLLIDQDGIPTLVEVKRATDTRIRREVVGQMMDYAANAVVYLPIDDLRAEFEARTDSPEEEVQRCLGAEVEPDWLWNEVKRNLESGRIRLLFVADRIPRELRRIVEFMNEQMRCDVLAVEVKQHRAGTQSGLRTLTATVYGRTERAADKKPPAMQKVWTEDTFSADAMSKVGPAGLAILTDLERWAIGCGLIPKFGHGVVDASKTFQFTRSGSKPLGLLWLTSAGVVQVGMQELAKSEQFASEPARKAVADKLAARAGIVVSPKGLGWWPGTTVHRLSNSPGFVEGLKLTISEVIDTLQSDHLSDQPPNTLA